LLTAAEQVGQAAKAQAGIGMPGRARTGRIRSYLTTPATTAAVRSPPWRRPRRILLDAAATSVIN
jgi:hypothetical protein